MEEFKGHNNRTVYRPFWGCRTFTDGVSGSFGVEVCYWSYTESVASVNNNSKATRRLYVKPDKTIGFYDGSRGNAFSVRCVLDE